MNTAPHWDTVLFDLSGTLINYRGSVVGWEAMERLGFTAVCDLLHANGHRDTIPDAELFHSAAFQQLRTAWHDTVSGRRNLHLHDLLREAVQAQGIRPSDALIQQAVLKYTAAISAGARPCLGAAETLRTLQAQGRKLGLISNTMWPGHLHHADLERFGLAAYLDVELYSADAGAWKPSAALFHRALEGLGSAPDRALFVGDSPMDDMVGAHNAGMRGVWIQTDEYPPDAGGDAEAVIHHLPNLLDLLEAWEAKQAA